MPPEDESEWKSKLVDIFGRPTGSAVSEILGIWEDTLRVQRFRRRIKLLQELEQDGLIESLDKNTTKMLFRGQDKNGSEGESQ